MNNLNSEPIDISSDDDNRNDGGMGKMIRSPFSSLFFLKLVSIFQLIFQLSFIYLFFPCFQVDRGFGNMYSLAWRQNNVEQRPIENVAIPHPPSPSVFVGCEPSDMLQVETQPPGYEFLFGRTSQQVSDMATTPSLDMASSPTDHPTLPPPISPGYNEPREPEFEPELYEFNQRIRPYIQQVVWESLQQAISNREARLSHRAMPNHQFMLNQNVMQQGNPPPRQMVSVQLSVSVNQWNSWLLFNEYIDNLKAGFDYSHVVNDAINTALAN